MNEYPNTLDWVRHKARWEQIPLGAVLNDYKDYIDELMIKEDAERNAEST